MIGEPTNFVHTGHVGSGDVSSNGATEKVVCLCCPLVIATGFSIMMSSICFSFFLFCEPPACNVIHSFVTHSFWLETAFSHWCSPAYKSIRVEFISVLFGGT